MKPYRHLVDGILAEGDRLLSWTVSPAADVWTLRQNRRIVAHWRESDAPGLGFAMQEILYTLAKVGPYALAAARSHKQQAAGGARRGSHLQAKRDEVTRLARQCIARGDDPKDSAHAWAATQGVDLSTVYRWIAKARASP